MRIRFLLSLVIVLPLLLISIPIGYSQLADTPWPMFHHDLQHAGQSAYAGPSGQRQLYFPSDDN